VVDREEGGADQLARHAVRLWPLFTASQVLEGSKSPANPHG
jgi:orotate phosphoribosyltransferase